MGILQLIGGILGLLCNIPLLIGIYRNKVQQNFTTWMLWAMLDGIAATSIILQHGNFWLPLGYAIGASSVSILLVIKKQISWTSFDTMVASLVIGTLISWAFVGNKVAIIASATALCIASVPQIWSTIKKPETTPTIIYSVFCLANLLSFIGGKEWSVEEKLYSGTALTFCLLLTLLSMRKSNSSPTLVQ